MPKKKYDIRTLVDGQQALRNYMMMTSATTIPHGVIIKMAQADRELRPVGDMFAQRRAALAKEFECSEENQQYVPGDAEGAEEKFAEFQAQIREFLDQEYAVSIKPLTDEEIKSLGDSFTVMHVAMMPFLFTGA